MTLDFGIIRKRRAREERPQSRESRLDTIAGLPDHVRQGILDAGVRGDNVTLAAAAWKVIEEQRPLTVRALMYRLVSQRFLPSTDRAHYQRLCNLMVTLRECEVVDHGDIVDNVRSTIVPAGWPSLANYTDGMWERYRLDFWHHLPEFVHIIVEKDAIAGTLEPVTWKYGVPLSPTRGYISVSFAWEIAEMWQELPPGKDVCVYYLGDWDASGAEDIEQNTLEKLQRYSECSVCWERLGVNPEDIERFDLTPLAPKESDTRAKAFVEKYGYGCVEVDALPPTELRRRVEEAIKGHIPPDEWKRLEGMQDRDRKWLKTRLGAGPRKR
jgi:hypothetical protein